MKNLKIQMLLILFCVHFSYHAWANQLTFLMADTNTYQSEIQKVNKVYGEAFIKGDSSLFINCYSPDACIMSPNAPIICGVQGQLAFFKFAYKSGVRNIKFTSLNFFEYQGEYVTEQGNYEMFAANDVSVGVGKYLVLWKKTPTGWKMYRDMFNSNTPVARPAK